MSYKFQRDDAKTITAGHDVLAAYRDEIQNSFQQIEKALIAGFEEHNKLIAKYNLMCDRYKVAILDLVREQRRRLGDAITPEANQRLGALGRFAGSLTPFDEVELVLYDGEFVPPAIKPFSL